MRITLDVPEDIAADLAAKGENLPRAALEALAIEEYRAQKLSTAQLRRLLGYQIRMQAHAFLKKHGVYLHYTLADLEHDRQAGDALPR
jgi:predicted HTH domain antitoxin